MFRIVSSSFSRPNCKGTGGENEDTSEGSPRCMAVAREAYQGARDREFLLFRAVSMTHICNILSDRRRAHHEPVFGGNVEVWNELANGLASALLPANKPNLPPSTGPRQPLRHGEGASGIAIGRP